jgi:hypothetical protein
MHSSTALQLIVTTKMAYHSLAVVNAAVLVTALALHCSLQHHAAAAEAAA